MNVSYHARSPNARPARPQMVATPLQSPPNAQSLPPPLPLRKPKRMVRDYKNAFFTILTVRKYRTVPLEQSCTVFTNQLASVLVLSYSIIVAQVSNNSTLKNSEQ
jgi:hypothetical protein